MKVYLVVREDTNNNLRVIRCAQPKTHFYVISIIWCAINHLIKRDNRLHKSQYEFIKDYPYLCLLVFSGTGQFTFNRATPRLVL